MPNDQFNIYKGWAAATAAEYRHNVNIPETLGTMRAKFDEGEIYRFASEICNIPIVQ